MVRLESVKPPADRVSSPQFWAEVLSAFCSPAPSTIPPKATSGMTFARIKGDIRVIAVAPRMTAREPTSPPIRCGEAEVASGMHEDVSEVLQSRRSDARRDLPTALAVALIRPRQLGDRRSTAPGARGAVIRARCLEESRLVAESEQNGRYCPLSRRANALFRDRADVILDELRVGRQVPLRLWTL
jgi:hypothetical protein